MVLCKKVAGTLLGLFLVLALLHARCAFAFTASTVSHSHKAVVAAARCGGEPKRTNRRVAPKTSKKQRPSTTTAMRAQSNRKSKEMDMEDSSSSNKIRFNILPAVAWLGIVAFAASLSDSSTLDADLMAKIIDNPINPGINELYLTLFNVFLPLPVVLAALVFPQGSRQSGVVPAGPFVIGSFALGYFALGPYLTLRAPVRSQLETADDVSWITQRVLESKLVAWSLVALLFYLPIAAHVPKAYAIDGGQTLYQGYIDLVSSSRFVAVSSVDLCLLHLTAAALVPADYKLRCHKEKDSDGPANDGTKLALAAAAVPFLGPALYVALRPQLSVLQDLEE